jgi:hypothetical protein
MAVITVRSPVRLDESLVQHATHHPEVAREVATHRGSIQNLFSPCAAEGIAAANPFDDIEITPFDEVNMTPASPNTSASFYSPLNQTGGDDDDDEDELPPFGPLSTTNAAQLAAPKSPLRFSPNPKRCEASEASA